jgi:alpha-glucosidase
MLGRTAGLLATVAFAALAGPAEARTYDISSPDREIRLEFALDREGRPEYRVSHHGARLIDDSRLGLSFAGAPALGNGLAVERVDVDRHDGSWKPLWGEYDRIRDRYSELTVDLRERTAPRRALRLVFRAYDDGVAFRYVWRANGAFAITSEDTEFAFARDFTAWWGPAHPGPGIGDEHLWSRTPLSAVGAASTPLTLDAGRAGYAAVHEADLIDYPAMNLEPAGGTTFRSSLIPLPDGTKVRGSGRHESPWRALVIGDEPGDLIESTLILNLNDPCAICHRDTDWIRPGKYVGVWWEIHKGLTTWEFDGAIPHGATTENAKRYIDFAARHDIPHVLTEGWNVGWDAPPQQFLQPAPDFDLEEVVDYAQRRGVNWMAHNETGGDVSNYLRQIEPAFSLYERLGVDAVKTGYAGDTRLDGVVHNHYDQVMVNHYRDHIRRAARHGLMVEAHEIVKDTGERRTYPNIMTREAVRGTEFEAWSEGNPPEHTVNLPFTRMIAGPMSYTPGIFDITWDPGGPGRPPWRTLERTRVHTTRAKQLAMYPVYLSGLQMLADVPEHYEGEPEFEFLEKVPTTWDDTVALDGAIGDYVTVARRSGRDWFVGSMTDEQPRTLSVPLRFLDRGRRYVATVYGDAPDTDLETNPNEVRITRRVVDRGDTLVLRMAGGGGAAVHLSP